MGHKTSNSELKKLIKTLHLEIAVSLICTWPSLFAKIPEWGIPGCAFTGHLIRAERDVPSLHYWLQKAVLNKAFPVETLQITWADSDHVAILKLFQSFKRPSQFFWRSCHIIYSLYQFSRRTKPRLQCCAISRLLSCTIYRVLCRANNRFLCINVGKRSKYGVRLALNILF